MIRVCGRGGRPLHDLFQFDALLSLGLAGAFGLRSAPHGSAGDVRREKGAKVHPSSLGGRGQQV